MVRSPKVTQSRHIYNLFQSIIHRSIKTYVVQMQNYPIMFTPFGQSRQCFTFHSIIQPNITFRIPPLVLETISVSLVVYKAILYFRLGAPKTWGGSRFMDSIVRYSVLYFITSVPAAAIPSSLPCLIIALYHSVLCVYVANLYVWVTQKAKNKSHNPHA